MAQADLHLHSEYSDHPSEWFLKRIGAHESYTTIDKLYETAKARGMDFVTITDHNTIDGAVKLNALYPRDTFISVEVTAYFPDDQCKVHILVYGLTRAQFEVIDHIRTDIHLLRDYLRKEDLAYSVAHATYGVNGRMTLDRLGQLVLLFDVFEQTNGAHNPSFNTLWIDFLQSLTPDKISELSAKHGIDPWGENAWVKGFTGGSDDHSGLFIGRTATLADGDTPVEFINSIRQKRCMGPGATTDYRNVAFMIYKIAWDFSCHRTPGAKGNGLVASVNELLFNKRKPGLKERFTLWRLSRSQEEQGAALSRFLSEVLKCMENEKDLSDPAQMQALYTSLARLTDDFFRMLSKGIAKNLAKGDPGKLMRNFSAALPPLFLVAPFFTAVRHLNSNRALFSELAERHGVRKPAGEKKVLWFTDTLTDLNGVSESLRQFARTAHEQSRNLKIVTCLDSKKDSSMGETVLDLPQIAQWTPEFYNAWTLRMPSPLLSMEKLWQEQPDEIIVSTPGPIGLLGLLIARLLSIPCTAVYHTDFPAYAAMVLNDDTITALAQQGMRLFYNSFDKVMVPSREYRKILEESGIDAGKLSLFKRGIETDLFRPDPDARNWLVSKFYLRDRFTIVWAGRMGREKNLDLMQKIVEEIDRRAMPVNIVFAGEGPEARSFGRKLHQFPNVHLVGRLDRISMAHLFAGADLLVFPSVTETFGMVVLEAQACGMPALVSDRGGPREIIDDGVTGMVLPVDDAAKWVDAIATYGRMWACEPERWMEMRTETARFIHENYAWERALDENLGIPHTSPSSVDSAPETMQNIQKLYLDTCEA